ncbi:MAG: MBL fold metallo-hydrolase [Euzebya sp.]
MPRELVVLGTAGQAPTRERNHNGYLLRWDGAGILFDPGEGTQRQMLLADVRSSSITHIAITHEHADHNIGLPGVLQRMALDQRTKPVTVLYPREATPHLDHLFSIGVGDGDVEVRRVPLPTDGHTTTHLGNGMRLVSHPLDHRVPTLGYRLEEPDDRAVDPLRLERLGLEGPVIGQILREGQAVVDGRRILAEQISTPRSGQSFAFVMDTRVCDAIGWLGAGCDLAVIESTYRGGDEDLAQAYGHMTAGQTGEVGAAAGVRRLVLAHYSQRYEDSEGFADEARVHHGDVIAAVDFDVIAVPHRLAPRQDGRGGAPDTTINTA